jgi:hypothetical protein
VLRSFPMFGIRKWLTSTTQGHSWRPLSDMHSYGTWLMRNNSDSAVLARWGNLRVSRDLLSGLGSESPQNIYSEIKASYQGYMSISFHHYLEDGYVGSE